MTGREAKTQYRVKEWSERIMARAKSGQPVRSWCADNNINTRSYYYWLRKVRDYAAEVMSAIGTEFLVDGCGSEAKGLVPIKRDVAKLSAPDGWAACVAPEQANKTMAAETAVLPIEIGKCRVLVGTDVDPELLVKVCKALVTLC